jgi:hypothetical protein
MPAFANDAAYSNFLAGPAPKPPGAIAGMYSAAMSPGIEPPGRRTNHGAYSSNFLAASTPTPAPVFGPQPKPSAYASHLTGGPFSGLY